MAALFVDWLASRLVIPNPLVANLSGYSILIGDLKDSTGMRCDGIIFCHPLSIETNTDIYSADDTHKTCDMCVSAAMSHDPLNS